MRHQRKTVRLGRKAEHRKAMLANQVCNLIEHQRIKTTLAKAKAVRPLAEQMVTLGQRKSDSASMAFIEWVDAVVVIEEKPAEEKKAKRKEPEAKPKKETKREEPKAKEKETPVAEEPKKKRRWFGRKSSDEK